MDPSSVVFGARLPVHTVTVELSVPDSGVTCLLLPWYAQMLPCCFRFRFVEDVSRHKLETLIPEVNHVVY